MYQVQSFNGADLPAKTLCLTFDDGPGNQTVEIARFLFENNIRATFFVVGKYAYQHPEILLQLKQMNHLIGNHTYEHPDLPYYLSADGNVIDQVLRTDITIKPYLDSEKVYFRPPYGKWSKEVAKELNQNIYTLNHIGPIHWDVAGVDCYYWQNQWSVQEAVERYLTDIERSGRGIVVMHDDIADMEINKSRNKTLELLRILIPQLLELDYKFVRLDEVPSVKEAAAAEPIFTLRNNKGKYVTLTNEVELWVNGEPENPQNELQLTDLGYGKVAIKAANNLYVSCGENIENVTASGMQIGPQETFDLIPVNANELMLRCNSGHFLSIEDHQLFAKAQYMRQAAIFNYANHNVLINEHISLDKRYVLLKKQLLFIKSKLQQRYS